MTRAGLNSMVKMGARPQEEQVCHSLRTVFKLFGTREEADSLFSVNCLFLVFPSVFVSQGSLFTRYLLPSWQVKTQGGAPWNGSFAGRRTASALGHSEPSAVWSRSGYESKIPPFPKKQTHGTVVSFCLFKARNVSCRVLCFLCLPISFRRNLL